MKKSNFKELRVGDHLSEIQYYEVLEKNGNKVQVKNERGMTFNVSSAIVEEGMYSATQHVETTDVTRTEMVAILEQAGETVFTVCFKKKPDVKAFETDV